MMLHGSFLLSELPFLGFLESNSPISLLLHLENGKIQLWPYDLDKVLSVVSKEIKHSRLTRPRSNSVIK